MSLRKVAFGALLAVFAALGSTTKSSAQTGDVMVRIEVEPIETLRMADFDPIRPSASPVVFRAFVTGVVRPINLQLEVDVESQSYGFLGTATLALGRIEPGQTIVVTNQDFDTYELSDASNDVIELATERGLLPPDDYYFIVRAIDVESGDEVGTDTAVITTTNSGTQIDLVGPGTLLDQEPEGLSNPYPIFQWFSDATRFNFALYEVRPGQTTAEDIVASLPVFAQSDVPPGTFVYPNAAEELVSGKRYAWQIEAISTTSSGEEAFPSELLWFLYEGIDNPLSDEDPNAPQQTVTISVEPQEAILAAGESIMLEASLEDLNNLPVFDRVPQWSVVPDYLGSVDENGVFTAGSQAGVAAVVAQVGDSEDYATIEIVVPQEEQDAALAGDADLQIMSPAAGQVVLEAEPYFSWMYMGEDTSSVSSYIVSLRRGGETFDAALPIWEKEFRTLAAGYPSDEDPLAANEVYHVRVVAVDSTSSQLAESEPVMFTTDFESKLSYELQRELEVARSENRDSTAVRVLLQSGTDYIDLALLDALEELGATLEIVEGPWIQISIAYAGLQALAELDLVDLVALPAPHEYLAAPQVARGDASIVLSPVEMLKTDSRFSSIDIAVFEFGFNPDEIRRLLPDAELQFHSFRADERIEGSGMADSRHASAVVSALAEYLPSSATLHLINFDTEPEFHHALDYAVHELGVTVITCSVSWANAYDHYDGSSYFSRRIAQILGQSTPLIAAAGNFAESHWQASYKDEDADDIHDFDPNAEMLEMRLANGRYYNLLLSWNDWGGDPRVDLDMEIYNAAGEMLLDRRGRPYASRSVQGPTEYAQPVERIRAFKPMYPGTRSYYLKVYRKRGTVDPIERGTEFELYVSPPPEGSMPRPVPSSSLAGGIATTDSRAVIPVGANELPHSSRGPTNDGRVRPDFSADGAVQFGGSRIRGTSFAAPRVAAAMALIRSRHPDWSIDDAYDFLKRFSVQPDGTPGKNARFGWGQIDLEALIDALTS
ncbi:MAG: S8 family serine peptidase [Rhodothermales bacterium]|nr:S8 family serine peptidase [Rhodothermales bacterium]